MKNQFFVFPDAYRLISANSQYIYVCLVSSDSKYTNNFPAIFDAFITLGLKTGWLNA